VSCQTSKRNQLADHSELKEAELPNDEGWHAVFYRPTNCIDRTYSNFDLCHEKGIQVRGLAEAAIDWW
jgi:hypothetical protein